jgi:magnesium transporter
LRDDNGAIRADFVATVAAAIETADVADLRELVGDLHEADLGALVEALAPEQRPRLVELLGIDFDFTALTEVDDTVREEILEELPPRTVAEGVRELESDDAVALLQDLPTEDCAEILEQLPPSECIALARSFDYPEGSAGRRMQTDFIAVPPQWNVGQAIDYMRETSDLPERFYELYVVDEASHFLGAVALDWMLRSVRRWRSPIAWRTSGRGCARPRTRPRWRGSSSATTGARRRSSTMPTGWSASSPSTMSPT